MLCDAGIGIDLVVTPAKLQVRKGEEKGCEGAQPLGGLFHIIRRIAHKVFSNQFYLGILN